MMRAAGSTPLHTGRGTVVESQQTQSQVHRLRDAHDRDFRMDRSRFSDRILDSKWSLSSSVGE
jgi:hypothetical protein